MKLNLGCGSTIPEGWINVDYSLGARLSKLPLFNVINKKLKLFNLQWNESIYLHNLITRFPWENSSVDVAYSSHTLEHMSKRDGRFFLEECHRVLKTGGIIRIIVPDLKEIIENYQKGELLAEDFVDHLGVLYLQQRGFIKNQLAPFIQFPHKCMYDTASLIRILDEIGFETSECKTYESGIVDINSIENNERTKYSVIVEGKKRA